MNHALRRPVTSPESRVTHAVQTWETCEVAARHRRVRALLSLFGLYAAALLFVLTFADGADIGCVLFAISGHVLYAAYGLVASWRDASWLVRARERLALREQVIG